jgi:hypothetical protein
MTYRVTLDKCPRCGAEPGQYETMKQVDYPFEGEKVVWIDKCILKKIQKLWKLEIETTASCCGHGEMPPWVTVPKGCEERLYKLGFSDWVNGFGARVFIIPERFGGKNERNAR